MCAAASCPAGSPGARAHGCGVRGGSAPGGRGSAVLPQPPSSPETRSVPRGRKRGAGQSSRRAGGGSAWPRPAGAVARCGSRGCAPVTIPSAHPAPRTAAGPARLGVAARTWPWHGSARLGLPLSRLPVHPQLALQLRALPGVIRPVCTAPALSVEELLLLHRCLKALHGESSVCLALSHCWRWSHSLTSPVYTAETLGSPSPVLLSMTVLPSSIVPGVNCFK